MKKSLVSILSVCFFLCLMLSVSAEDHKHKLHEIGERIKQAVKAGKITEKEGWMKWHAVLREHEEGHEDEHEGEEDERGWAEVEELEHEIEIRELEFELERLEQEHDMQLMQLNHERERMQREFDRERRDWDMENLQWDMRRKQMEMQIRGGHRPSGTQPEGHDFVSFLQEAESFFEQDPDLLHPPDLQASFFPHSSFPFLQADFSFFFPHSDLPLQSGQVFPSLAGP